MSGLKRIFRILILIILLYFKRNEGTIS